MLVAAHLTVGAAVASTVPNPLLGGFLAFALSYIIDCIPHAELTKNFKPRKKIILTITDFILSTALLIIFARFIPEFINAKHLSDPTLYTFQISNLDVIIPCIAAILPNILIIPKRFFNKEIPALKWNTWLKQHLHFFDNGLWGKLVHPALIWVLILYIFRLLPNSENGLFGMIMILMLIVVSVLALLETFTENTKAK